MTFNFLADHSGPWRRSTRFAVIAALLMPAFASGQQTMSERLDRLDRAELLELLDKSEACVRDHDFSCAESSLSKARKFATGGKNLGDWTRVNRLLAETKSRLEQERLAREKAAEEAARERRRIARQEEEREQEREQAQREDARRAARAQEREDARAEENAQIAGAFNAVITNFNNINAAQRAQQVLAQQLAAQRRASEADAERNRQRAAAQRLADERGRQEEQRAARERRQRESTAESLRADRLASEATRAREREQEREGERERERVRERERDREREQRAVQMRQQQERDKAERLARQEADKAAARKEMMDFHAAMASGIRLVATKCPDGAGHYYATGSAPRVKEPGGSACIDVQYEASCPDNRPPSRGVAKTFVGMAGCFGDTYQIEPKPDCDVKNVRVRVVGVQSCS
ncbi:hypothetical protein [Massilia sp. DWR3-1-1]|uniref:hypothetical protein n=1 Tax=Massilia sp. DWR3-1-1 TaxID=2804559 RepID=UPI003CF21ED1